MQDQVHICSARFGTICTNWKTWKNTRGGVLFLVKLLASACNFPESNTPPWLFFTFLKLYKWYQIAQSITYLSKNTVLGFSTACFSNGHPPYPSRKILHFFAWSLWKTIHKTSVLCSSTLKNNSKIYFFTWSAGRSLTIQWDQRVLFYVVFTLWYSVVCLYQRKQFWMTQRFLLIFMSFLIIVC